MKVRQLVTFTLLFLIEGVVCLFLFLRVPSEPGSAQFLIYSYSRLAIAGVLLLVLAASAVILIRLLRNSDWAHRLCGRIDSALKGNKPVLSGVQTFLMIGFVFAAELFFLTYISIPALLRPFPLWAALICLQAWLILRIGYSAIYTQRLSLFQSVSRKWSEFLPVQRKTFLWLAAIGLIYFCVFIPLNAKGWKGPVDLFYSGVDEVVQYSSPIRALTPGSDFSSSVYRFWVDEGSIYGHPYVTLSAAVLLLPRLIFGVDFGDQVQLNMFLMRQFLNVLPIILSIFFLVYLVTRFKLIKTSIFLYVFLLTIPGVIKFNIRFLHPDSIILLLVVLTIYFLQKDNLQFKRNFFLAAVTCGLAIAIKLWGFFFFLVIAVYLLAGLKTKTIHLKSMLIAGAGFILVMFFTVLISNPSLLVPSVTKTMVASLQAEIGARGIGYTDDLLGEGVYQTGILNWMRYFEQYFIRDYYFYFCFFALIVGSFLGATKNLGRILTGWCAVTAIYLIYFVAVKSFWYMLPLMVPLYVGPFLLPGAICAVRSSRFNKILAQPLAMNIVWGIVLAICGSQFVINIVMIVTSPMILSYA